MLVISYAVSEANNEGTQSYERKGCDRTVEARIMQQSQLTMLASSSSMAAVLPLLLAPGLEWRRPPEVAPPPPPSVAPYSCGTSEKHTPGVLHVAGEAGVRRCSRSSSSEVRLSEGEPSPVAAVLQDATRQNRLASSRISIYVHQQNLHATGQSFA